VTRFILNRAFYSLITLWLLVTIVFCFVRFTGDPTTMLEEVGDAAYVEQLREQWGLDRPYYVQYGKYMWGLLRGDFGNSFQKSLAVRDIYLERLPNSLKLGFAAFVISIVLGVPMGILSAMKVQTWWDNFGKVFAILGLSVPNFFIGLMLIVFFGVYLGWLPILGKGEGFWDWRHLIMPAFALGWYFSGILEAVGKQAQRQTSCRGSVVARVELAAEAPKLQIELGVQSDVGRRTGTHHTANHKA
jgi:peptide/nickel transport system permease protein